MSFKLIVLISLVAAISCATLDSREQVENFDNHGMIQLNDQIRFHQRFEENRHQDKFDGDRRNQDRFDENRFKKQEQNFNNRGFFDHQTNPQNPTFLHLQPAVFNVQSSSRHFNVQDDSNYDVAYSISDMTTGDIKTHQEKRRGDEVHGQYTIVDSDGFQRKVNYRANDRDGFDAEVKREPIVGFGFTNNYQEHHNQHNFKKNQHFGTEFKQNQQVSNHNFQNDDFQAQLLTHPKSVATITVSKTEDGQHNQYTTHTSN